MCLGLRPAASARGVTQGPREALSLVKGCNASALFPRPISATVPELSVRGVRKNTPPSPRSTLEGSLPHTRAAWPSESFSACCLRKTILRAFCTSTEQQIFQNFSCQVCSAPWIVSRETSEVGICRLSACSSQKLCHILAIVETLRSSAKKCRDDDQQKEPASRNVVKYGGSRDCVSHMQNANLSR